MTRPVAASLASRLFRPIAEVRAGEGLTAGLMFLYSFLAMTAHNVVKPITRSQFIASLGADNLPWVQFAAGVLIGLIMQAYTRVMSIVPRRWTVPATQAGLVALLVVFWLLFTLAQSDWVAVGFYLLGLIMGILLISQFWTIANDVYDARQAKRLFGLIGGGASLGGATGAAITTLLVERLGSHTLLLISAATLGLCALLVFTILRREKAAGTSDASAAAEERGTGAKEAFRRLRESRHLRIIALVIGFVAIGAAIIEQQLNMAAAEAGGSSDAIAALLAQVIVYLSLIGFLIQVLVTSRVHRVVGIGVALLILPVSLGASGILMLAVGAFWTAALARILDSSLRYTIDKTSREVLFLPLPLDLKYLAKPFVDVSVDRFAKGLGALLLLVLIKDWGFGLGWRSLSYASLVVMASWIALALRARREYLRAFGKQLVDAHRQPASAAATEHAATAMTEAQLEKLRADLAGSNERARSDAVAMLAGLRMRDPELTVDAGIVRNLIRDEAARAFDAFRAERAVASAAELDSGDVVARALSERRKESIDRVFDLLALVHPADEIRAVQHAYRSGDSRARASASEYIDNLLEGDLRRRVILLVEDMSDDQRLAKGTRLYRRTARSPRQLLAELARDGDPEVMARASALAERIGSG